MKKYSFYMALAIVGVLVSCAKQEMTPDSPVAPAGIKVVLTVNDAQWTGEDTKTAFTADVGISLTGDEEISLFYEKNDQLNDNIQASPVGGVYSFTMPAEADGCTWYGLMPYSDAFDPASLQFDLTAVQSPGANTFDPAFDLLVAQPFTVAGASGEKSAEINSFKRLFAPFCLSLSGLGSGERIYNVSMQLNQAPTTENTLAGTFGITMSDSYAGTYATVVDATKSNEVSAVYADGLAAVDGRWPVWLMVNPMTIDAGCEITVSVTTATNTYTRTVALPSAFTFKTDEANRLKFNIKGSGYEDITNDYYAQYQAGLDISINGTVFNKATQAHDPRLMKLYSGFTVNELEKDYSTNGILFLDYDLADATEDVNTAPTYHLKPANVVIIGRYRNHQPLINLGAKQYGPTGTNLYFKNVAFTTTAYMFITSNATGDINMNFEDCTLEAGNNDIFVETNTANTYSFAGISINNCVIKLLQALYRPNSAWASETTLGGIKMFWMTNSVVYASSNVTASIIDFNNRHTPNLDLKFDHNTFYNIWNDNSGIIRIVDLAKFNFNYCVGDASCAGSKDATIVSVSTADIEPNITESTLYYNYFNERSNASNGWRYGWSQVTNAGIAVNHNIFTKNASPFNGTNTTTGYFPINTSVVTGNAAGAGASYTTKYWKTWE